MKNKIIYFFILTVFIISPFSTLADGGAFRPLPNGDFTWVDENEQQAFINYEEGTEKLIIGVDFKKENSDTAWIIPVPGDSKEVNLDITSKLPIFFGDDLMSKAKMEISEILSTSYFTAIGGQIWPLPISSIFLVSLGGARSSGSGGVAGITGKDGGDIYSGDSVYVQIHIEKEGMVAELISAKNSRAIYSYLSDKGFNIDKGSIPQLDSYIEKNYTFVVSWITASPNPQEQRGIFITFPTANIYYPMLLTSGYGEKEIPITIRVLGHVQPEIFSEIKKYTKVSYFTERTSGGRYYRCESDMRQLSLSLEMYFDSYGKYPISIEEGNDLYSRKEIYKGLNQYCQVVSPYYSENGQDYNVIILSSSGRAYKISSRGVEEVDSLEDFAKTSLMSLELEKFYGDKIPWKGEEDYTKITINAPSKLFKDDLWMKKGAPWEIYLVSSIIKNSEISILTFYLLIAGITSFVAGGIAGFICFRKFKKYAFFGLANLATLICLILVSHRARKKEEIKYSKTSFTLIFSVIFILLLLLSSVIPFLFLSKEMIAPIISAAALGFLLPILLIYFFAGFLMRKLRLKESRIVRAILTILLIIFFSIIMPILFFWLLAAVF